MFPRLARILAAFHRESRGNVAITFGIAAIPIILSVGAAVDYSLANRTKTVLDHIANAASLSAVS
jgi:Flp pilus assembly protein TadG